MVFLLYKPYFDKSMTKDDENIKIFLFFLINLKLQL